MRRLVVQLAFVVAVAYLSSAIPTSRGQTTAPERKPGSEVDRERAIQLVHDQATKAKIDTSRYVVTACQVEFSWRVYLEPAANFDLREVWEYPVSKKHGVVYSPAKLKVSPSIEPKSLRSVSATVNESDAIAVAKKDAERISDLSKKQLTVCELMGFWKIIYAPPAHLDGGGPEYLIDKKTGTIVDKKYYQ